MLYSLALRSENSDSERLHVAGCLPTADGAKRGCHTQPGPFSRPPSSTHSPQIGPSIHSATDYRGIRLVLMPCGVSALPVLPVPSSNLNRIRPHLHDASRSALPSRVPESLAPSWIGYSGLSYKMWMRPLSAARSWFCLFPVLVAPFSQLHRPQSPA